MTELQFDPRALVAEIGETLGAPPLCRKTLIGACDALSAELNEREHLPLLRALGLSDETALRELALAKRMLRRDYLERRVALELGPFEKREIGGFDGEPPALQALRPLGVLFHISAGNMEGLPAFSVLEGLLAGNINLLKLPSADTDVSRLLLESLIAKYPLLKKYVYVFDFPSADLKAMGALAALANAVVVWGGDEAVASVRRLAPVNTKIIKWGHKLSFAYVTPDGATPENLRALAQHICDTEQLLCNSCQGVYFDCGDKERTERFAERFFSRSRRGLGALARRQAVGFRAGQGDAQRADRAAHGPQNGRGGLPLGKLQRARVPRQQADGLIYVPELLGAAAAAGRDRLCASGK